MRCTRHHPPARGLALLFVFAGLWLVAAPALAGGSEFPAGGTRSLGRGGAAMARADDPSVMTRNPALLSELWDDQALIGAHLLLLDACFTPTGALGWGVTNDVSDFGDGPVNVNAAQGDTNLDGDPSARLAAEPYPKVCYDGPAPFLPQVAFTTKLSDDLGVGFGYFPPDTAGVAQWGNRDGTVDTDRGRRPNILRFLRSHQNVSFFTLLAAAGYRISDFVRVGVGLQWNLAIYEVTAWTTPLAASRDHQNDIRTEVFGKDLFIPGAVASVHLRPLPALDVALGFKWVDRVQNQVKLDLTTGAFGTGELFEYRDASGMRQGLGSAVPTTAYNQTGEVSSPPIYAPQLSLGLRYASLLKPRPPQTAEGRRAAAGVVEDAMQTERWDVELDAVYYLNSSYDEVTLQTRSAELSLNNLGPDGEPSAPIPSNIGKCLAPNPNPAPGESLCPEGERETKTEYAGVDQLTLRLGGDYNLLPGLLALRGGVSYETSGQDVEYHSALAYMQERIGLHAGLTVRVARRTDISFGFAHFIQQDIRLQLSDDPDAAPLDRAYKTPEYNFKPGAGVGDATGAGAQSGGFDGNAAIEVPNGDAQRELPGPFYVNAGSYTSVLDVLSLSFAQHF